MTDGYGDRPERRISRYRRDLRSSRSATRDPEHERSCPPDIYILVWVRPGGARNRAGLAAARAARGLGGQRDGTVTGS
jgi:hypothetical protein